METTTALPPASSLAELTAQLQGGKIDPEAFQEQYLHLLGKGDKEEEPQRKKPRKMVTICN